MRFYAQQELRVVFLLSDVDAISRYISYVNIAQAHGRAAVWHRHERKPAHAKAVNIERLLSGVSEWLRHRYRECAPAFHIGFWFFSSFHLSHCALFVCRMSKIIAFHTVCFAPNSGTTQNWNRFSMCLLCSHEVYFCNRLICLRSQRTHSEISILFLFCFEGSHRLHPAVYLVKRQFYCATTGAAAAHRSYSRWHSAYGVSSHCHHYHSYRIFSHLHSRRRTSIRVCGWLEIAFYTIAYADDYHAWKLQLQISFHWLCDSGIRSISLIS